MNPEQEIQQLRQQVELLQAQVNKLIRTDRYYMMRPLNLDNTDIVLSQTTGTKIGTAVGQKMGFWGATPVVKYPFGFNATVGSTYDAIASSTLEHLRLALISYGIIYQTYP